MNFPTHSFFSLPQTLISPITYCFLPPKPLIHRSILSSNKPIRSTLRIRATASDNIAAGRLRNLLPTRAFAADKVLRLIASATSSPIGQFISTPKTFLHSLDPRIKLVWLLALVIIPARSNQVIQFSLVMYLAFLSIWILPKDMWMDQLGRVSFLSGILFLMLALGSDGVPPLVQSRTPTVGMTGLPSFPASSEGYSYLIMKLGPLTFTRKGLSVASSAACLTFLVFQSASLCLTTTAPEQLASALRWFMSPLSYVGVPVAEITLTLLLSLRFVSLVFDEPLIIMFENNHASLPQVRNVAAGIISRRINWTQLTIMETIDVFCSYFYRIFKNIFNHAEQISQAMIVRGFRGDSNSHKLYSLSNLSFGMADAISLLCLIGIVGASILSSS